MESIDRALIEACIKGDRKAQKRLYMLCFPDLMRLCMRYHKQEEFAAETLNSGFFKVLTNLEKLPEGIPFMSWAKRVVLNNLIDEYRKQRNYKENILHPNNEGGGMPMEYLGAVDYNLAESRLGVRDIMRLVDQLPEGRREIFLLYAVEGYTHQEIGDQMGIPEGTSKWHVSEARKFLKEAISAQLSHKVVRNGQIG